MNFLLFGYGWMLPALALASVPVIIHILNKRKHRVVDWGAMRFLMLSVTRQHRRTKFEEWLLLLLRTLLVAALVMMLSRPLLPDSLVSDPNAISDVVFVIDAGQSMQARAGKQTKFDLARAKVNEFIGKLPPGHSVGVVLARDRVDVLASPAADPTPESVKGLLDGVRLTPCNPDLPGAAHRAVELLGAGVHQVKKLIIVTDGRRQGWGIDRIETWQRVEAAVNRLPAARSGQFSSLVLTVDEGDGAADADEAAGLAVRRSETDRTVGLGRSAKVVVEIENVSARAQDGWSVRLVVNGDRTSAERKVLDRMEPATRLPALRSVQTNAGETVVGLVSTADAEGVTLRTLDGATKRIARTEMKTSPGRPADLMATLRERLAKAAPTDSDLRYRLAEFAAAGGEKAWAVARVNEVLAVNPGRADAARLAALLQRGRAVQTVRFETDRFTEPGSHLLEVELIPPGLAGPGADPRHVDTLALRVARTIPVLILNGDPYDPARHRAGWEDEVHFLRQALRPDLDPVLDGRPTGAAGSAGTTAPRATGRKPSAAEVVAPDVFTRAGLDRAVAESGASDIGSFLRRKNYRVVVLANLDEPGGQLAEALRQWTSVGGGLLVAFGDRTKAAPWNELSWLPASFRTAAGRPATPEVVPPTESRGRSVDTTPLADSEMFYALAESPALAAVEVRRWWRLQSRTGDAASETLLSLRGSVPLLVGRTFARGRVVCSAVPLDRDWHNMPFDTRAPAYVILVHELVHHLAGGGGESLKVRPGEEFLFRLPEGFEIDTAQTRVDLPRRAGEAGRTGTPTVRAMEGRTYLVFAATEEPGVHKLRIRGRDSTGTYARPDEPALITQDFVVDNRVDSDPEPLGEEDRKTLAVVLATDAVDDPARQAERLFTADPAKAEELVKKGSGPKAIWQIIAWGTVAFLLLEVLMTRRIARRTHGAGSAAGVFA